VSFVQASLKVEREQEFAELKAVIQRAFAPEQAQRFLKELDRRGIRIRDFDAVLISGALGAVGERPKKSGNVASGLYQALPVSDQAQIREFYLSRIEEVDPKLRAKFQKLYRYY